MPAVTVPLDEIEHRILTKAAEQFADVDVKHERIRAVDSTHTGQLLPAREDHIRYRAEAGVRFVRRLRAAILEPAEAALRDGREHVRDFDSFTLGLQVRADDGHETCLAVRITGSVPANLAVVVLGNVPGCDKDGWYPEYALPERDLLPAEQAWSNLMDPREAAKVLGGKEA